MATRISNPSIQHFDKSSPFAPLSGGQLFFYEPGTTTFKDTFTDSDEGTPNTNPVILDADGREPDIFGNGSYRMVIRSSVDDNNRQIDDRDPVNFSPEGAFGDWSSTVDYGLGGANIVTGSDGNFYISIQSSNLNQDPTTSPTFWTEFDLLKRWNTNETYDTDDPVLGSDGNEYTSISTLNVGNDPTTTSTFWKRVGGFDGASAFADSAFNIPDNVETAIPLDDESFDTKSFHDNVTNNTRITIPTGVSRVSLTGQITTANASAGTFLQFRIDINDSGNTPAATTTIPRATGLEAQNVSTGPIDVVSGDYFELKVLQDTGGVLAITTGAARTYLNIEVLE